MSTSRNPMITVGIVVMNREWILGKALGSLLNQTYPHDKIFVLIVDGESKDKTVELARNILMKSDVKYDIIVKKCNCAEGRNICIENMRGDMLFFWDSDIIMKQSAMQDLLRTMIEKNVDMVTGDGTCVFVDAVEDIDEKIREVEASHVYPSNSLVELHASAMANILISRKVLDSGIRFDPEMTNLEDADYSMRATEKGFKILMDKSVLAIDVNIRKKGWSDSHMDMPLKDLARGMRKKAKVNVLADGEKVTFTKEIKFFLTFKRYPFYLGYIPTLILTIYGLIMRNLLILVFPVYLLIYAFWQIKRRGIKRGIKAVERSIIVGVPTSLLLVYYFTKYAISG